MSNKPKIFLVDGYEGIRDSVQMLLESEGMEARTFANIGSFLAAVSNASELPDCVVSDLPVSGEPGTKILDALATLAASIPIIILSVNPVVLASHELSERVTAVFTKPADPGCFIEKIKGVLQHNVNGG